MRRVALAGVIGAGLITFWIVPFLAHRDLQGAFTTWATPTLGRRLHDILTGDILFPLGVGVVVVAAWLFGWLRVRRGGPFALSGAGRTARFPGRRPLPRPAVAEHDIVAAQFANRGLAFAGVMALFPLASLLADLFGTRLRCREPRGATMVAVATAALVVVGLTPWLDIPAR